jgi:periplasmic protein TonB
MIKPCAALAAIVLSATAASAQSTEPKYQQAKVSQADGIPYPINSQQPAFVSLDVLIDTRGAVQNVVAVRDVPPLTAAAEGAVKTWQFTPATLNGDAVPGIVRVNVAFNPFNPSGVGLPGGPLQPPQAGVVADFQPPGLLKANYAVYPPNTVTYGTVILDVKVGSDGSVGDVTVNRGKDTINAPSINAAKTWQFAPATFKGKPLAANTVVVFVYPPPQANTR